MSLFHRHKWQEVQRNYTPPRTDLRSAQIATVELVEKLTFGVTVVEQNCVGCGELRAHELIGDCRVSHD